MGRVDLFARYAPADSVVCWLALTALKSATAGVEEGDKLASEASFPSDENHAAAGKFPFFIQHGADGSGHLPPLVATRNRRRSSAGSYFAGSLSSLFILARLARTRSCGRRGIALVRV